MAHPPSVKTCRQEYQKFLQIVNSRDMSCLWEQLSGAIRYAIVLLVSTIILNSCTRGPPWKVALASSLIDVLLIDYHSLHTRCFSLLLWTITSFLHFTNFLFIHTLSLIHFLRFLALYFSLSISSAVLPPPPLFYTLFWKAACSSDNITRPVRQLLELTATSEDSNNYEKVFYNSEHIPCKLWFLSFPGVLLSFASVPGGYILSFHLF